MTLPTMRILPESAAYNYKTAPNLVSVELEGGLSRTRRDLVGSAAIVKCQWKLDRADYQYFMAFFKTTLNFGANPFNIDLILDQPTVQQFKAKFVVDTLETNEVRGLMLTVRADLEVIPIIDEAFDEIVVALYESSNQQGGFAVLNALEKLANVDLAI